MTPHNICFLKCNFSVQTMLTNLRNLYSICLKAIYSSMQYVQTLGGEEYSVAHRIIFELAFAKA